MRSSITVGASVFDADASAYIFTVSPGLSLEFAGNGVTNNSGVPQNFVSTTDAAGNFGVINFSRHSTAGDLCTYRTEPGTFNGASGSFIQFYNFAEAADGTFINKGAKISGGRGGETDFFDTASAGTGIFTAIAGTEFSTAGGTIAFFGSSTASGGEFTAKGSHVRAGFGGDIYFRETPRPLTAPSLSTAGRKTFPPAPICISRKWRAQEPLSFRSGAALPQGRVTARL
ncbi:MAG: hypothetical protein M3Q46_00180 [Verrucomicrobiota bacterium]|nr:hypothetical protein [Verrucomicrobiota bacterium]